MRSAPGRWCCNSWPSSAIPLVIILLAASALSAFTGDVTSFFIIVVIVVMSVSLDFVQEYRAGQAAERLRQSVAVRAHVLRDGQPREMPVAELVPGDVVLLSAGDLVPADGRVLEAHDFFVNQALLTGESYPVEKRAADLPQPTDRPRSRPTTPCFMGTSVISGSARVLVVPHRAEHRAGRDRRHPAGQARRPPPSSSGTQRFGMLIMRLTLLLVLFVLLVNACFHRPLLESFLFAVALAVGLTPELLPMVVSVTLARGALRMAAQQGDRQAAVGDPGPGQHGRAVHRQDRHADRGAHPARAARRRRSAGTASACWSWPTSTATSRPA